MALQRASAVAPANIAFIKYWGMRDGRYTLPYNGSISMNVDSCLTTTTVTFDPQLNEDEVTLTLYQQEPRRASGRPLERVVAQLDRIRSLANIDARARVESSNNFPADAGIASSAAAFAALTVAGVGAAGLELNERELTQLTRLGGSGSACRSISTGYVEWAIPDGPFDAEQWNRESYAFSIAPPEHWALADVVAVVDMGVKKIGSAENHHLVSTSNNFATRLSEIPARLEATRTAIANRDLTLLGETMEADAVSMHIVCMTMNPPSFYWNGGTLNVIHAVRGWREEGLEAYYTIDAGPNVHVICAEADRAEVERRLQSVLGVQFTIANSVGQGARLIEG